MNFDKPVTRSVREPAKDGSFMYIFWFNDPIKNINGNIFFKIIETGGELEIMEIGISIIIIINGIS